MKGQLLTEFYSSIIREIPFTRSLVSRVLAQLYDAHGIFLSPVLMGMKVFFSGIYSVISRLPVRHNG